MAIREPQRKRFRPMLSATLKDYKDLTYPVIASPKVDGVRAFTPNKEHGIFDTSSRKLIPISNTFTRANTREFPYLDGELCVGPPNDPNTYARTRKDGVLSNKGNPDFTFWVFDRTDTPDEPFVERYKSLTLMQPNFPARIQVLQHFMIETPELLKDFEEYCVSTGYEGIMTRAPGGVYKWGRSTLNEEWLVKWKRFEFHEATVVGFVELEKNMNELTEDELGHAKRSQAQGGKVKMGTLGSLVAQAKGWDQFNVGSGFSAAARQHIWDNRTNYMGRTFRFKYQEVGSQDAPRIPIFSCWL